MPRTYCPNCDEEFNIGNPKLGAAVSCRECGADLEVISVKPLEVDFPIDAYDDEDWEDDEE
jgi:lysine biosynthesis protein LysW